MAPSRFRAQQLSRKRQRPVSRDRSAEANWPLSGGHPAQQAPSPPASTEAIDPERNRARRCPGADIEVKVGVVGGRAQNGKCLGCPRLSPLAERNTLGAQAGGSSCPRQGHRAAAKSVGDVGGPHGSGASLSQATAMTDMGRRGRQHPRVGSRRNRLQPEQHGQLDYGIDAKCFAWVTAMPWGRHKPGDNSS